MIRFVGSCQSGFNYYNIMFMALMCFWSDLFNIQVFLHFLLFMPDNVLVIHL